MMWSVVEVSAKPHHRLFSDCNGPEVPMEEVASAGRAGVISAIGKHYAVDHDLSASAFKKRRDAGTGCS